MEPNEKLKFDWTRLLTTAGIVLVATLVVGGTIWYVMDKSAKAKAKSYNDSIAALQKQVNELKAGNKLNVTTQNSSTSAAASATVFDIRHVDLRSLTGENTSMGTFEDTIYADLTNDSREEAVVVFRTDGTGGYRDVFIFGNASSESSAKTLYKGTGFTHGQVAVVTGGITIKYVDTTDPINVGKPNSDMVASRQDTVLWDGSKFVATTKKL